MKVRDQILVAVAVLPGKLSASSTEKEVVRAAQQVRMLGEVTNQSHADAGCAAIQPVF